MFAQMMQACLMTIVGVLERQYKKYFDLDISLCTNKLREEIKSARSHNIDAEEIMGMFSAAQQKSPNATVCYLGSKMRAQKNKTVDYLDNFPEERQQHIVKVAIPLARKTRQRRRKQQKEIRIELSKRLVKKRQQKETTERKKPEKHFSGGHCCPVSRFEGICS